jgi:hypothetical protein
VFIDDLCKTRKKDRTKGKESGQRIMFWIDAYFGLFTKYLQLKCLRIVKIIIWLKSACEDSKIMKQGEHE